MIPSHRHRFNAEYSDERYDTYVRTVERATGVHVHFPLCETPCFLPASLIDRLVTEAEEHQRADANRREVRMLQNKLEGMIYTNDKVFREFGKMLNDEDRDRVQKCITKAKESVTSEERQRLNDAIFDLQTASRILTGVMLYNPVKMNVPGDTA